MPFMHVRLQHLLHYHSHWKSRLQTVTQPAQNRRIVCLPAMRDHQDWCGSDCSRKKLYDICTMSAQRRRRWADVVQMLCKCFVIARFLAITKHLHNMLTLYKCHTIVLRTFPCGHLAPSDSWRHMSQMATMWYRFVWRLHPAISKPRKKWCFPMLFCVDISLQLPSIINRTHTSSAAHSLGWRAGHKVNELLSQIPINPLSITY